MARRKRNNNDLILPFVQLAILFFALIFARKPFQQLMPQAGPLITKLLILVGSILIVMLVVKVAIRWSRRGIHQSDSKSESQAFCVPPRDSPLTEPVSTGPLADQLRALDWFQFEKVVAALYKKLGYTVTRRGGANADGGIDLILEKEGQRTAVQCKQWKMWNVGVRAVREFLGALTDAGIQRGIFITLCGYTGDAKQLADKHGIQILNETDLVRLFVQSDARFDPELIAALSDQRKICPKCESEMVLRTAKKGFGAGKQFWGCSTYPRCHYKMPIA